MTQAVLRATNELGDVYDDPSEDLLFELVNELGPGNTFLIVGRLDAADEQHYVQALRGDNGTWAVEYREGNEESHRVSSSTDSRQVHKVIAGWAFGSSTWRDELDWSPLH